MSPTYGQWWFSFLIRTLHLPIESFQAHGYINLAQFFWVAIKTTIKDKENKASVSNHIIYAIDWQTKSQMRTILLNCWITVCIYVAFFLHQDSSFVLLAHFTTFHIEQSRVRQCPVGSSYAYILPMSYIAFTYKTTSSKFFLHVYSVCHMSYNTLTYKTMSSRFFLHVHSVTCHIKHSPIRQWPAGSSYMHILSHVI